MAPPREGRVRVQVHVLIRDNLTEREVRLTGQLPKKDVDFINLVGERIAQDTGWDIRVLAVEEEG